MHAQGALAVLQAAEVHHRCAHFVVEVKGRRHLQGVLEVEGGDAGVAEEQSSTSEVLAQAHLQHRGWQDEKETGGRLRC